MLIQKTNREFIDAYAQPILKTIQRKKKKKKF